jgi:hypothetical protein
LMGKTWSDQKRATQRICQSWPIQIHDKANLLETKPRWQGSTRKKCSETTRSEASELVRGAEYHGSCKDWFETRSQGRDFRMDEIWQNNCLHPGRPISKSSIIIFNSELVAEFSVFESTRASYDYSYSGIGDHGQIDLFLQPFRMKLRVHWSLMRRSRATTSFKIRAMRLTARSRWMKKSTDEITREE